MIISRHSEIVGKALNEKIYLTMELGSTNNEEEKCYGLAQSHALDGFLYRAIRWNWLFDSGGDIIT